jgi:nucleotide-binding universal stress UspA family protein
MSIKTILVHAEPTPVAAQRLAAAAALAKDFDATLVGVGAEMFDWVGVSDPYGFTAGQWITVMREQMDADLKSAAEAFEKAAAGVKHEWDSYMETPALVIARLARGADLIVAGGAPLSDSGVYRTASPADLVMHAGRPVLVAPPSGGSLRGKHILVAWKDSRESRRAVADALPFLKRADEVVVMEVCETEDLDNAKARTADVVRYLETHGVKARAVAKAAPGERAATELNIEAEAIDADLIVCGAYGHSRLQEFVLGGVTQEFLRHPERFVLLSH